MADWKKIIVSGSDAHLRTISASHGLQLQRSSSEIISTEGGDITVSIPGITGNSSQTPLVIDANGNIHTGSNYALESGGNTVGGSNLDNNFAIIGAGDSLITTASSNPLNHVNFNGAFIKGVSNISASGTISGSIIDAQNYNINNGGDITGSLAAFSGSNAIVFGDTDHTTKITGSNLIISTSTGVTMSAVPTTIRPSNYLGLGPSGEIIKVDSNQVQGSGGGTGGVVGLQVCDNGNINLESNTTSTQTLQDLGVSVVVGHMSTQIFIANGSSDLNSILTPQAGDTIHIEVDDGTGTETFVTTIVEIGDGGTLPTIVGGITDGLAYMPFRDGTNIDGSGNNFALNQTNIFNTSPDASAEDTLTYTAFQSMSIEHAFSSSNSGTTGVPSGKQFIGTIKKLVTNTSEGVVEICLDDNLAIDNITSSGDIMFVESSSGDATVHQISYEGYGNGDVSGSLLITASHVLVSGNLDVDGNADIAGTLSFDGFTFSDGNILVTSGSTTFGDTASQDTHQFTGSVLITGSLIVAGTSGSVADPAVIISGAFHGDGTNLDLSDNTSIGSDLFKTIAVSGSTSISTLAESNVDVVADGNADVLILTGSNGITLVGDNSNTKITFSAEDIPNSALENSTISGIALGQNLNSLTSASNGGIQMTSYNGSSAVSDLKLDINALADQGTLQNRSFNIAVASGSEDSPTKVTDIKEVIDTLISTDLTFSLEDGLKVDIANSIGEDEIHGFMLQTSSLMIGNQSYELGSTGSVITGLTGLDVVASTITILSSSNDITIGNSAGVVKISNDLEVKGDLTVLGDTIAANTTNLYVEDRFILLGSGSAGNSTLDIGIIFNSGSVEGTGTALYMDKTVAGNGNGRLSVAKGVADSTVSAMTLTDTDDDGVIDTIAGTNVTTTKSDIVTVVSASSGNQTNGNLNSSTTPVFGQGELQIDDNNNIWIYVD